MLFVRTHRHALYTPTRQHSFFWPLWTPEGVEELYGERPKEEVESRLQWVEDIDGQYKVTLYGSVHYANHLWWRTGARLQCAHIKLTNLTYIRTADSFLNHLLRPLFADVQESDWPPPPDMNECVVPVDEVHAPADNPAESENTPEAERTNDSEGGSDLGEQFTNDSEGGSAP